MRFMKTMTMTKRLFPCIALTVIVAANAATVHAQNASSPSVQEQLEAQYPLAKMTARGGCTVSNPDTGLALQKAGAAALPQKTWSTMCASHYRSGSFTKPGFRCTSFLNMSKQSLVNLEKGDKVFPTKIEMGSNEVKVAFGYCSGDAGQAAAYAGELVIEFPKDTLKTASVNQIEDKIAEVLSADSGDQQGNNNGGQQDNQQAQGNQGSQQNNQSSCNPEVGQTVDQVTAACGPPANQTKGATKVQYFYNDPKIKVIFVNGKVSDIE